VFEAIFFVILILMGFNVMTWEFLQYDIYNGVLTSMSQQDQQALSESLAATAPGATGFAGNSFNIIVNDTGSVMVTSDKDLHLQLLTYRLHPMLWIQRLHH